ncbi:MAG: hypothetical protein ACRD6X_04340 [Pyrinomonadaceae bacterium]
MRTLSSIFLSILFVSTAFSQGSDKLPKLKAEEIIAKHLASIGTSDAIAAAKTHVYVGTGTLTSRSGFAGTLGGPIQFASSENKLLFALILNSNDYPYEKVGYDGKSLTTGRYKSKPTILGEFLRSNSVALKRGLFGGVLNSAWPPINRSKGTVLEADGTGKVGDLQAYKLKFISGDNQGLIIKLYFDSQNFRHLRTEYETGAAQLIGPNPNRGIIATPSQDQLTMIEEFSGFATSNGLTLPLGFKVEVSTKTSTRSLIWTMKFSEVYFNEVLEDSVFKVS